MSEFVGNNNSLEELNTLADQRGCEVVVAKDNQLQLGLDNIASLEHFQSMLGSFGSQMGLKQDDSWSSKSGNKHVVLSLPEPMTAEQRIVLQACFGSDRKRELLSFMGAKSGSPYPIVLFRPKQK